MTGKEILALEPGPELNRLVGELMGGNSCKEFLCPACACVSCRSNYARSDPDVMCLGCSWKGTWNEIEYPDFSGEIVHAWKVAEWCAKNNPSAERCGVDDAPLFEIGAGFEGGWYAAWIHRENDIDGMREHCFMQAFRPTVMHAICFAALLRFHEVYSE